QAFGKERVARLVHDNAGRGAADVIRALDAAVQAFLAGGRRMDALTPVVVKRRPERAPHEVPSPRSMPFDVASRCAARTDFRPTAYDDVAYRPCHFVTRGAAPVIRLGGGFLFRRSDKTSPHQTRARIRSP